MFQEEKENISCTCCFNSMATSMTTDVHIIYRNQKIVGFILFGYHITPKPFFLP